jgi:hypothetical protein
MSTLPRVLLDSPPLLFSLLMSIICIVIVDDCAGLDVPRRKFRARLI